MGLFEKWPYTNFHDLNLDWIIKKIKRVDADLDDLQDAKEAAEAAKTDAQNAAISANASALSAEAAADAAAESEANINTGIANAVSEWAEANITVTEGVVIDASLTVSGAAADAKVTGNRIRSIDAVLPKTDVEITGTSYANLYINANLNVGSSTAAYIDVVQASVGDVFNFKSEAYSTAGAAPAIAVSYNAQPVAGTPVDHVLLNGASANTTVEFTYTAIADCYIYVVQHTGNRGVITIYKNTYDNIAEDISTIEVLSDWIYPLKGKTIAVMGDSIMQYMSGGYGGANVQTFVENGNVHTYDEITITDGIPYYNGNICTVVNDKQSYYDNQGWELLKNATGASKIINCSIGGSGIKEGTISTAYPGYESGTHHTNSLPNLVKWLFRMCENNAQPDIAIIWMGTNLLSTNEGDIDIVFNTPWETLASNAGHALRQTTYGALRYAIEKIYREMPNTYIMVLGPIQADTARFTGRTFEALKSRSEAMKAVAERISIKFIEPLTEIEIYGPAETTDDPRYLVDGLHCNDAGKALLTAFLNKKIITNYTPK